MKPVSKGMKSILVFTMIVFLISVVYYFYAATRFEVIEEQETFLSEIGESFGEFGLFLLIFIYARTAIKLLLGKGAMSRRLLPEYTPPVDASLFSSVIHLLDRTHIYVGITAIAIILLHIFMMGIPMHILFFPMVLALVIWQGVFGLFLSWRYSPKELKKFSYLVHAQLFTGIMIGLFAFFGHMLIDD